jgi:hypothetical protein
MAVAGLFGAAAIYAVSDRRNAKHV